MEFTGERYVPSLDWPELSYEHWHRYLYATKFVSGKRVLDLSCGEGFGANLLAEAAANVVGVDIDADTVAHAAARYVRSNLTFLRGSAESVPLEGKHLFDAVVSFETIEHLNQAQQIAFLDEIKRLLTPKGQGLFSTPNKLVYSDRHDYQNEFHQREFYRDEFVQFLEAYFRHVSLLGQHVYPASYIWPADPMPRPLWEFQLSFTDAGFTPEWADQKERCFFLAICSDEPLRFPPAPSLLLDLSERATTGRLRQLEANARAVRVEIEQNRRTIQEYQSRAEHQTRAASSYPNGAKARVGATRVMIDEMVLAIEAHGGEPFISATPNPVPGGSSQGTTWIDWSTGTNATGWVFVASPSKEEQLFATGAHGSQSAPWIERDAAYTFALYADEQRSRELASVNVKMDSSPPHAPFIRVSTGPRSGNSESTVGTGTVEWSTGDGSPGWVYLRAANGKQALFAEGARGSLPIAWTAQEPQCQLVLVADEGCRKELVSVTVFAHPHEPHIAELSSRGAGR